MPAGKAQEKTGPPIDIVFCLDLSNSSNGLIDQFRNHIWDYWYFLTRCKPKPNYRIGVVTFARFSYGKANGYSKVMRDLGTDFERLSNILFKIPSKVEKGDQYVGSALNTCLKKLSWSKDPLAKKIIFLVGNGDVYTGKDDLEKVLDNLVEENILVQTIYCTAPGERKAILGWQNIAQKTGGKNYTISLRNHYFDKLNDFDVKRFRRLNRRFNYTYLYYGKEGRTRWRMMQEEDNHIYITNTEGFRYRSWYKISPDYLRKNSSWDLVDYYGRNKEESLIVDRKFVNDTCKKMSEEELRSYILLKKYERKKIASMISKMMTDKEKKDLQDGVMIERNALTLDVLSLRVLKDILKEKGCSCISN